MNRSNLLSTNLANIDFASQETGVITLLANDGKLHRLLLSWDEVNVKQLMIYVPANSQVDILEMGEPKANEITYHLGRFSTVNFVRASLKDVRSNRYIFNLEEGAHLVAGLADFAHGKKKEQVTFHLHGRDSYATWRLSSFADQLDEKEYDVSFIHYAPSTYGSMANFGVVADTSKLIFSGVSHILNGATNAKTHQNAKIMVFDKLANAKANPILKIDENQVEASHAAAVGKVNDEHLFYLCSRGLTESQAKRVITLGYLNPILEYFTDETIKDLVAEAITKQV